MERAGVGWGEREGVQGEQKFKKKKSVSMKSDLSQHDANCKTCTVTSAPCFPGCRHYLRLTPQAYSLLPRLSGWCISAVSPPLQRSTHQHVFHMFSVKIGTAVLYLYRLTASYVRHLIQCLTRVSPQPSTNSSGGGGGGRGGEHFL